MSEIQLHASESHHLLMLSGPVGLEAARDLQAEGKRLAVEPKDVAIDWRQAEHVGASALQVLLALALALSGKGHKLYVADDNPAVRGFLELAGLSAHFPVQERW